jgi:DNA-binding transcriptional regulator YiaG
MSRWLEDEMTNEYHYTTIGLDNVYLVDLPQCVGDDGDTCTKIERINLLHKAIAAAILKRKGSMNGPELKFLRTLMGMTQAELAKVVNRDAQTIGRWERKESDNDPNAEALIRLVAAERLQIDLNAPTEDVAGWCIQMAAVPAIRIDASDSQNYRPIEDWAA